MTGQADLRIATWNIDHARNRSRDADRTALINEANADVLVLTETCDDVRPAGAGYQSIHSEPRPHCPVGERWVSIWTRLAILQQVPTRDPLRTVAATLSHAGQEFLVYGTVLPWHADVGDARTDPAPKRWVEHRRVVAEQTDEWKHLSAEFPSASLVIAGDWNTDLLAGAGLTRHPYGTTSEARLLMETMRSLGINVPTRGVADPGPQRPFLIDHIALGGKNTTVETRSAVDAAGVALSDHPLVLVCT